MFDKFFEKKKLIINSEICDARKIKEEDYAQYEQIILNTEFLLVNERATSVLARLPMIVNSEHSIDLPEDTELDLRVINGAFQFGANTRMSGNTVLVVNGAATLQPGAEEALTACYRAVINGSLRCPKSMEGYCDRMTVNGAIIVYPDEAILLEDRFVVDRFFPLRARQDAVYFAADRIVIADPALDMEKLAKKNLQFVTKKLVTMESMVEALAPMFDVNTDFVIVPDEYTLVEGGAKLDEALLQKYGTKLYVYGGLEIPPEAGELIGKIEKLIVKGTVTLTKGNKAAFDAIGAECDGIEVTKGTVVKNAAFVTIDKKMLQNAPNGVCIKNVGRVTIREDVSPEELAEKAEIVNTGWVKCSPEQAGTVSLISCNCGRIDTGEEKNEDENAPGVIDMVKAAVQSKIINAETHIM